MTTRKANGTRQERLPSSFLASRRFTVRRLRARVLSSLNLKKKRGCSQSNFASNDTKWIFRCSYRQINDYHNKAALILNPKFLEDVLAILCDQTSSLNLNKLPSFNLGSIYSTNASGAEQMPETNNLNNNININSNNDRGANFPHSQPMTALLGNQRGEIGHQPMRVKVHYAAAQSMFDLTSPTQTKESTNQIDDDTRAYCPLVFLNGLIIINQT